ncbi:hypothetical protein [Poseidonocella sedimentorum]|uniref:DUF2383 domain-containing protein n=1 Tax=Poseidonocella sedimentorum TaxID=871652 RepID=A0A1I6DI78_9RHOB|nr:hypothetical protein [Poseidonocella sedimentorum]SFR05143.1 hypothetical protein SAMN04515673_103312 [Poseidonocella sedimentorum]
MIDLVGERNTDRKAVEALAELHLALRDGIALLDARPDPDDPQCRAAMARLAPLHRDHQHRLDEMADIFDAMAETGETWAKWLHDQAGAEAGAPDPVRLAAIRSGERRILGALDACMAQIVNDPVRGTLEQMRQETNDATEALDL